MRVLIVARNKNGQFAPFITEQVEALKKIGVSFEYFGVSRIGIIGYLRDIPRFRKIIKSFKPDIIHAHYGLCGVFANMQRSIPVVTTYHGSDINNPMILLFSKCSIRLSAFNIFVSAKTISIAKPPKRYALIPCGVSLNDYPIINKREARRAMGLKLEGVYVLFAGSFDNEVKDAPLARAAMAQCPNAELIELKGFSRTQVATLLQAVDAMLLTSKTEGSPQVIKEAMVCGCPIVSVDVGDVRERISGIDGCYVCNRDVKEITNCLQSALLFKGRTIGREVVIDSELTNDQVAPKVLNVYKKVLETH